MEAKELLSTKEAAEYLGISTSTLYRIFKTSRGKIKRCRIAPKAIKYSKVNLDDYKKSQTEVWTD